MDVEYPWQRGPDFIEGIRAGGKGSQGFLIVAAHPDDEVIGAFTWIASRLDGWVAYVTDGAPRNLQDAWMHGFEDCASYARERTSEAEEALALARFNPERVLRLWFPDQETTFCLTHLAESLWHTLVSLRPAIVITHAYEGGHPDHDSTCFAVHAACRMLAGELRPTLLEMTSYHLRDGAMETGCFLPATIPQRQWRVLLGRAPRALKAQMLACHRTQQEVLREFKTDEERYRLAPAYNFKRPPHLGQLLYEYHDWGVSGEQWREAARQTTVELNLGRDLCG